MTEIEQRPTICVLVCTRQRPIQLEQCLREILKRIRASKCIDILIVIENEIEPTSKALVELLAHEFADVSLTYIHEPILGIPMARNRALVAGLESQTDWLGLVDDDEVIDRDWLEAMRSAGQVLDAEVLTGPVRLTLPADAPDWIVEPKSKLRKRGSRLRTAAANNTLVKASWLRRHFPELRFDEDFRFSGGEDTDFFFQVADRGGRIVWVDDAIVTEQISLRRASLTYQLMLACRTAENAFRIHKKRKSYAAAVWRYLPKAIGRLARGSSLVVGAGAWWLVDRRYAARLSFLGGKAVASAAGTTMGVLGYKLEPYRNVID